MSVREIRGFLETVCRRKCTEKYGTSSTDHVLYHHFDCLYNLKNSKEPDTSVEGSLLRLGGSYERELHDIATERGCEVLFWYYGVSVSVLATRGGTVVGNFSLEEDLDKGLGTPTIMKLTNIFVEPNYRRDHIGTLLMELAYWLAFNRRSGLKYWWVPPEKEEGPAAFHAKVLEEFNLGPVENNRVEFPFEQILLNKRIGFSL